MVCRLSMWFSKAVEKAISACRLISISVSHWTKAMSENEVDSQIENLRRRCESALQRRLDNPDCLSPAALIRILSPVIEKYLLAGLVLEEVAKALQEEGFSVTKGHLVRHLGMIRAEKGLPPIKPGKKPQNESEAGNAPPARVDGGQRDAKPSPSPAPAPRPAPQPRPLPGEKNEDRRPAWISEEMWALKPKIDKILSTFPTPDREYPELADARWWTDKSGKRWDVRGKEKPDDEEDRRQLDFANIRHGARWRGLMEKWGLAEDINGILTPRYKIADEYHKPLIVDLDEIIAKHLD
jgi:hypothetical protein